MSSNNLGDRIRARYEAQEARQVYWTLIREIMIVEPILGRQGASSTVPFTVAQYDHSSGRFLSELYQVILLYVDVGTVYEYILTG